MRDGHPQHIGDQALDGAAVANCQDLLAGAQASHALTSLAPADGLLDLQPQANLVAGTMVRVMRIH